MALFVSNSQSLKLTVIIIRAILCVIILYLTILIFPKLQDLIKEKHSITLRIVICVKILFISTLLFNLIGIMNYIFLYLNEKVSCNIRIWFGFPYILMKWSLYLFFTYRVDIFR